LHEIQHTRWEILQTLKRRSQATVDELAQHLGLAPMTVRQHLTILERDGLVAASETRKGAGRPSHLFSLAPAAEELFPKGYDRLAERVLAEFAQMDGAEYAGLTPDERLELLFTRLAQRQALDMEGELGEADLAGRVARVSALLRDREGTLSEWTQTAAGFRIDDYNCPFRNIALQQPALCNWHLQLLTYTLHTTVEMEGCIVEGGACCSFKVHPQEPAPLGAASSGDAQSPALPSNV
jgi:predicted ArsR family transcriptional regulator